MSEVSTPEFGMFSDSGNQTVYELCIRAKAEGLNWPQVYNELYKLSRTNKNCGEATDTEVREMVYSYLGFKSDFYC